jgi:hypothetical protein
MHLLTRKMIESKAFLLHLVTGLRDKSHQSVKLESAIRTNFPEVGPDLAIVDTAEEEMTDEFRVLITNMRHYRRANEVVPPKSVCGCGS